MTHFITVGRHRFSAESYRRDPAVYSDVLGQAREAGDAALCTCTAAGCELVIRRRPHATGDAYRLAIWPQSRAGHAPSCPFSHAEISTSGGQVSVVRGISEGRGGFCVTPAFSLVRPLQPSSEQQVAESRGQGRRRHGCQAQVSLLALAGYLVERTNLHHWSPRTATRCWPTVSDALRAVVEQGSIRQTRLSDLTYVAPRWPSADHAQDVRRFQEFRERFAPSATSAPRAMVIGELRAGQDLSRGLVWLTGVSQPILAGTHVANRLRREMPAAVSAMRNPQARVLGVFLVEVDAHRLVAVEAALLAFSRDWVPAESSYEIAMAIHLVRQGRAFQKPMRTDDLLRARADFILTDTEHPIYIEVAGMNTEEYRTNFARRLERYAAMGVVPVVWRAADGAPIPALPPRWPGYVSTAIGH